jgi:hypothetical protein
MLFPKRMGNTAIESFLSSTFCIISFCSDLSCRIRFISSSIYFLSETLTYIASPIIFLFIHNHLTLRKSCYTRLQHDLPLDPIISPYHFHFQTFAASRTKSRRTAEESRTNVWLAHQLLRFLLGDLTLPNRYICSVS